MVMKVTYRIILLGLSVAFMTNSCSTSRDVPCPDFRNNKSYSRKYKADYRQVKKQNKYYSVEKIYYNSYQNNIKKYGIKDSRDYTINSDKNYNTKYSRIKSIPGKI
jgi:hypothetical protein